MATATRAWSREELLAAVDLPTLADELLGQRKGGPTSPVWPCPNTEHRQTGRTPPVTVFAVRRESSPDGAEQRWKCHGCGVGGTAVDLVMWVEGGGVGEAFRHLKEWVGSRSLTPDGRRKPSTGVQDVRPVPARVEPWAARPSHLLREYVADCERALSRPEAHPILRWLEASRGLPRSVLRVNRIGADLGWKRQGRPVGVPKVRAAVVLPILVEGQASYVQLRTLNGSLPKYLNPTGDVINPRVGFVEPAEHFDWPFERRELIVAEGILDALSAAAGGYRAAAVLSASYADPVAARILAGRPERLVVAFDPDPAGRRASEQLVRLLTSMGRAPGVMVLRRGDLNDNLVQAQDWAAEMAGRVQHAVAQAGCLPPQSVGRCIA